MPKEITKITTFMKQHLILLMLVVIAIVSCNKIDSSKIVLGKMIFSYDSINSKLVDVGFKYDSLFVNRKEE